jgi:quercetin 2,3-dioxygenase
VILVRKSGERGHEDHGWLNTYHAFSFASYYDPANMGFRSLRVINEDRVTPGEGFPPHSHNNMEIISYVLEGGLEHRDSMGNGGVIRPGEVQRMSAGTGVTHSEFNASKSEGLHFLQIWLLPDQRGLQPSYEQKSFPTEQRHGKLRLIASTDGSDGAVTIHQDAKVYATLLAPGQELAYQLDPTRYVWVQVAQGAVTLNGQALHQGDAAAVSEEDKLTITAQEAAEVLLFDLA